MDIDLRLGNCLHVLKEMDDNSVDSIVCDPPYGLSFMGSKWDYDVPSVEIWRECLRVLKHGGHLLAFSGTRTYHRVVVNIENAGFEIRDQIQWIYGEGFPKSHNISKAIDKRGGESIAWFGQWLRKWRTENEIPQKEISKLFPSKTGNLTGCVANWELGHCLPTNEQFNTICATFDLPFSSMKEAKRKILKEDIRYRSSDAWEADGKGMLGMGEQDFSITESATSKAKEWDGWGTALKPANEPICLARKPLIGTVVENVLEYGTGAMNIDECRANGRWPANVMFDEDAAKILDEQSGFSTSGNPAMRYSPAGFGQGNVFGEGSISKRPNGEYGDSGGASRFFYCAKANQKERNAGCNNLPLKLNENSTYGMQTDEGLRNNNRNPENRTREQRNNHPTVKPIDLMRYLCRLITPPEGIVLDPFMGSGTTGIAACLEGFNFVGIELDEDYLEIARHRIAHWGDYEITESDTLIPQKRITEWL